MLVQNSEAAPVGRITKTDLEKFIRENVPLTEFMNLTVEELNELSVKVSIPFKPNGNHYGTAFGGSISTLGIVTGWALLHSKVTANNIGCRLAIGQSSTKFIQPAVSDIYAECYLANDEYFKNFAGEISSSGKAHIKLTCEIKSEGKIIAKHEGLYYGLPVKLNSR